jgi:hypothetical protein
MIPQHTLVEKQILSGNMSLGRYIIGDRILILSLLSNYFPVSCQKSSNIIIFPYRFTVRSLLPAVFEVTTT